MSAAGYTAQPDEASARSWFLDYLEALGPRIERTKAKMRDLYAFRTPEAPYTEYRVIDLVPVPMPDWAAESDGEGRWADALMRSILDQAESTPYHNFVPCMSLGGISDFIPALYGMEFDYTPEAAVINRNWLFRDADDLERRAGYLAPLEGLDRHPRVLAHLGALERLIRFSGDRIDAALPQMQGPLTNACRLLPQEEMLVAVRHCPDALRALAGHVAGTAIEVARLLHRAAAGRVRLRPRGRFWQPEDVQGLYVDDFISVIAPEDYLYVTRNAWQKMKDAFGRIFLHTCGPVVQAAGMMAGLPGLAAFETAYARGQRKTMADLEELKDRCRGRLVACSFELPSGDPVGDRERFTLRNVATLSEGGGMAFQAAATRDEIQAFWQ